MPLPPWLVLAAVAAVAPGAAAQPETAILAGGCFWCLEAQLSALPGVMRVETGYSGGTEENPTFQSVLSGTSAHVVAVRVTFDAEATSFRRILGAYWLAIDPTDGGGQFCERGPEFRPAIFYADEAQRLAAAESLAQVATAFEDRVAVPILPAGRFWRAEEEHQDYAARNPARYDFFLRACGRADGLRRVWSQTGIAWPDPGERQPDGRTAR